MKNFLFIALLIFTLQCSEKSLCQDKIDRHALVTRHNVNIQTIDTLGSLNVGNGKFSFTVDATGLQSFPEHYQNGVPLGTQSEWGWHTSPNEGDFKFEEALKAYDFNGNPNALYAIQDRENEQNNAASDYFRSNPHRLQLGNVGLIIIKKDGSKALPTDIKNIDQTLNLWTGQIESKFEVEGSPIKVLTYADAETDAISVKIESPLIAQQRLRLKFRFPYPTGEFSDKGTNYTTHKKHTTTVENKPGNEFLFSRTLDNDRYFISAKLSNKSGITKIEDHYYSITPSTSTSFEATVTFSENEPKQPIYNFTTVRANSGNMWKDFWLSGGAVDFSECTDERAFELERRVVLSQYLTRSQCAGNYPVQETGLTYNSWFGKPHMEMYWWHTAHYPLWGRTGYLEKSIGWYFTAFEDAKKLAQRQGYEGVRWQKMTDNEGGETSSNVGSFLIWQQPHVIYLAELIYRDNPKEENLKKYQKLIFETADFMASYANYDAEKDRYILGKGVIPAQECFDKLETYNPPLELSYWKWALERAQEWKKRLGMDTNPKWQKVIDKISPMAQQDGVYLAAESVPNSYSPTSKHTIDHPAVLGAMSFLPQNDYVDIPTMNRTFDIVDKVWNWDHTWGWDFPLEAMTANRLNRPEDAIKALLRDEITNTYLPSGHNYQTPRLTLYLPGNGGYLAAVAMMCAGFDGNTINNPGFPKDGTWKVKWEGLTKMP